MKPSEISAELNRIRFTDAELAVLRLDADEAGRMIRVSGLCFESYQQKRLKFALEINEGNAWSTEKSLRWARRIKRELSGRTR